MSNIWSKGFWKGAAERVVASTAGGAVAVLGADLFGAFETDWQGVLSVAVGAGIFSLLKALASTGATGTLSVLGAEVASTKVVEQVEGRMVVAGEGHDSITPGAAIRKVKSHG